MLRRKALLASQVGSRAMELEFHLTEDVDTLTRIHGRIASRTT